MWNINEAGLFFPYGADPGTTLATQWWLGSYNDVSKDSTLVFTFDRGVEAFALDISGIDLPGHYMVAFNANNVEIGRVSFVADPVDRRDQQEIVAAGIRRVVYYFPVRDCTTYCFQSDPAYRQAAFEHEPPVQALCPITSSDPQQRDSLTIRAFNDPTVRRALEDMLGRSDTTLADTLRHEEAAHVHVNPDGTFRVEPAVITRINHCSSSFPSPLTDPTLVAIAHSHPFHEGDRPKCPGLPPNDTYQPNLVGGMSREDETQFLFNNALRALNFGSSRLIAHFIIDLDYAWYIPWDGDRGSSRNKSVNRRAGTGGTGCKWV